MGMYKFLLNGVSNDIVKPALNRFRKAVEYSQFCRIIAMSLRLKDLESGISISISCLDPVEPVRFDQHITEFNSF